VDPEVTPAVTARAQLAPMAKRATDRLAPEQLETVADMGAYNGDEVKKGLAAAMVPSMSQPNTSANSQ
jgi:hypothetical protein